MTRQSFERKLASLAPDDETKITALIEEYRKDVTDVQAVALRNARAGSVQVSRARSVVGQLAETAVGSLAATVTSQEPVPDPWLLIQMVDGVVFAETAVTGRLKNALTDTRMVPQSPEMRALEEVGPPYRVCDEAYVALRRILNSESYLQHLVESRHFLSLRDAAKNREIESWLQTGSFTQFLDNVDAEED